MNQRGQIYPISVLIAYYLTLSAFFVASFFPQYRVWGISWWAYFPLWVRFGLLVLGAVAPFAADRLTDKLLAGRDDITLSTYRRLVGGFAVILIPLFYLLRARTHFLGDGYTLLSMLCSESPFIKPRNLGGTVIPYWIFKLIGRGGEDTALLAYQIVSIGVGILFLAVVIWSATKLVSDRLNRLLLILSVCCGGYMLMFFGYVENYALWAVLVAAFCLLSLEIVSGKLARWWILPALGMAIFLHIFGIVLVPVALYLFVQNSKLGEKISATSNTIKAVAAITLLGIGLGVIGYFYSRVFFFQFALLPLFENRFTVDGYTLFSLDHLVDFGNLLFVLTPGLAVALAVLWKLRSTLNLRALWILGGIAVCCLGAAFVFDPKMGMPRDWDLFAFAGLPLVLFLTQPLLAAGGVSVDYRRSLLLVIVLSSLSLFSRAAVIVAPGFAVAATVDYISLDRLKSYPARFLIVKYLDRLGEKQTLNRLRREWDTDLMTNEMEREAVDLMDEGRMAEALPKLRRFVACRPNTYAAWEHLGQCFYLIGQLDSALQYLRIADGINPYNAEVMCNIGLVCNQLDRRDEARDYFEQAFRLDSMFEPAIQGLVRTYREQGDTTRYLAYLQRIAARPSPPSVIWNELIAYYLRAGQSQSAAEALKQGIAKGLDTAHARTILELYPQLRTR